MYEFVTFDKTHFLFVPAVFDFSGVSLSSQHLNLNAKGVPEGTAR